MNLLSLTQTIENRITIHDLARAGDVDTFQTISLDRFDINEKDSHGLSPLTLSSCFGHREFSRYLLALGADPNSIDNSGNSVLMKAAARGHYEIIKYLIEAGADVSYTNPKGESALEFAQISGRVEAIDAILLHKVKPKTPGPFHTMKIWTAALQRIFASNS
ncbi:MAG: ankyrin repeat domain-containing protein [Rhizobacter sp.]|nr:ankyrin repeat domain-containing protein [Bacteriovorax sp.]